MKKNNQTNWIIYAPVVALLIIFAVMSDDDYNESIKAEQLAKERANNREQFNLLAYEGYKMTGIQSRQKK